MRGSGSAVIIMGDRAHAWPEIHVAGVGWITFDIYPQQSDEPPPQVVAQSLESLLGEIARDDPTGGRANPNQSAFAIPWATIGSWMAILLGFILGLAYLVKLSRWSLPLLRPGSHRLAFVAVLDGMSNVGQERRFGETRESHADRVRWLCPSFEELTRAHLRLTLDTPVKAIGIKSATLHSGTPRNESEFTLHAKTTGLDKPMGMVVYTMSEMNTLDVDLDSFLESEDGENRATGHRISIWTRRAASPKRCGLGFDTT